MCFGLEDGYDLKYKEEETREVFKGFYKEKKSLWEHTSHN